MGNPFQVGAHGQDAELREKQEKPGQEINTSNIGVKRHAPTEGNAHDTGATVNKRARNVYDEGGRREPSPHADHPMSRSVTAEQMDPDRMSPATLCRFPSVSPPEPINNVNTNPLVLKLRKAILYDDGEVTVIDSPQPYQQEFLLPLTIRLTEDNLLCLYIPNLGQLSMSIRDVHYFRWGWDLQNENGLFLEVFKSRVQVLQGEKMREQGEFAESPWKAYDWSRPTRGLLYKINQKSEGLLRVQLESKLGKRALREFVEQIQKARA